ncbi:hypothetical protein [Devosia sp. 2618]|uniref:hypothetical protein n=1 Tax=Devosia sp. 2618 TaxID=3156454 RepID=UPI003394B2E7
MNLAETERPRWRAAVGLIVAAALLTFSAMAIGYHQPPERGEIGVVFPPWVSQIEAFDAVIDAGGRLTAVGRFPNIVIAFALDGDFAQRVTARGALFVTAARGLCAPVEEFQT